MLSYIDVLKVLLKRKKLMNNVIKLSKYKNDLNKKNNDENHDLTSDQIKKLMRM